MPSKEYMKEYRRKSNPKLQEKHNLAKENKKRCTKCKEIKEIKEFTPQKTGFLKVKAQCRSCDLKYDKIFQSQTNFRKNRDNNIKSKKYRKEYYLNNIEWWRKYEREYRNKRKKEDMFFKIKSNLSSRLSDLINKSSISQNTLNLIGCNKNVFLKHIESLFKEGMTWNNYGLKGWHIDHIIPLSSFDLTKEEEVKKACHYTNLQPLWWYDNLLKGNKIYKNEQK